MFSGYLFATSAIKFSQIMDSFFRAGKSHLNGPVKGKKINSIKLLIAPRICNFFPMQRGTVRRTKIISTLGPATDSAEMIGKLMDAGVNIFRLNMSHAPHEWVRRVVKDIRAAAAARENFTGIMMDTQGPAIRTGDLGVPLDLQPGQKFTLTVRGERDLEQHSVDVLSLIHI